MSVENSNTNVGCGSTFGKTTLKTGVYAAGIAVRVGAGIAFVQGALATVVTTNILWKSLHNAKVTDPAPPLSDATLCYGKEFCIKGDDLKGIALTLAAFSVYAILNKISVDLEELSYSLSGRRYEKIYTSEYPFVQFRTLSDI